ncbi:hypothetical protein [Paenibacillus sp. GbtcB18]|uniref:hypothetical protein n=1 Tax=Paenibacillus sp. GbtcB18 TaxID=2824763 RepID=UPI001C311AB2|nr:hypothetical protein [Paenibacillus sp. GbtcB18]
MNEEEQKTVCPWCQTEIVWDPEIGPEEECPHCYNELSDYRSIRIGADEEDADEPDEDAVPAAGSDDFLDWEEEDGYTNEYAEAVRNVLDTQEEAPECSACRELMLHGGTQVTEGTGYAPVIPGTVGKAFLNPGYKLNVFVCPSCFKVETFLAEEDREKLLAVLNPSKEQTETDN